MTLRRESSPGEGFVIRDVHSFPKVIDASCVDARSTGETHQLQSGLVLGTITATGKLVQYSNAAGDGSQTATHILMHRVDMKNGDPLSSAADQSAVVMKIGSVSKAGLGGYDAAAEVDMPLVSFQ